MRGGGDWVRTSRHVFVESLPDLIHPGEYDRYPDGNLVRLRISVSEHGVEILGDGLRPGVIEDVLKSLEDGTIEQMLCG